MIRLALILACLPLSLGASDVAERLRALVPPPDPYAADKANDLARIHGEPGLFPNAEAIAVFVGPDCARCEAAQEALQTLAHAHGVSVQVIDIRNAANAGLMQRLTLDLLPSYVMPDRLIRGEMPTFVLERYLTE